MNNEEAKELIKNNLDCRDYLTATPKAGNDMYECPVCHSGEGAHHTGAVKYYPETNTWYCHACHSGGDVIALLEAAHHESYAEALKEGAAAVGITIDSTAAPLSATRDAGEIQTDIRQAKPIGQTETKPKGTADYTAYIYECAARIEDPEAIAYLKSRGISLETAKRLWLGYDPAADPAAAPGALSKDKANKRHPEKRLIIQTATNHYVARAISNKAEYAKMNPSTSMGAGSPGIFHADAVYTAHQIFVTEGWADAASIVECGAEAIALNSTNNGRALLDMLRNNPAKEVQFVVTFDNDSDPATAARTNGKAMELVKDLQAMGYKAIKYNVAGEYHDINDALKGGGKDYLKASITAALKELQRDYLSDFCDKIQGTAYKPVATGMAWFDELLGGGIIQQSLLLLLAAPGAGKTTLCQQIAEGMARKGKDVVYLNFEMSREQMLAKAISARICQKGFHVSATQVMQGYKWDDKQKAAILAEVKTYRQESFPHIQYNTGTNCSTVKSLQAYLERIGTAARREGRNGPAVVLDYLQLMISDAGEDQQTTIKETVMLLKDYAREYNTFVIGIVATNRESNKSGVISLTSGRDSSNIEYTADIQISLNYEDIDSGMVKPDDVRAVAELQRQTLRNMILRVLKNRFAMPGKEARVYFNAADNLFLEMGKTEADDGAIWYRATHDAPDQAETEAPAGEKTAALVI